MDEASSSRTCLRWLKGRVQKNTVSGHVVNLNVVSTQKEPGVKYRPTVTENGHTERSNSPDALGLSEQAAKPQAKGSRMP